MVYNFKRIIIVLLFCLFGAQALAQDITTPEEFFGFQMGEDHIAGKAVGVEQAGYVMLRLPLEVRDIFRQWL